MTFCPVIAVLSQKEEVIQKWAGRPRITMALPKVAMGPKIVADRKDNTKRREAALRGIAAIEARRRNQLACAQVGVLLGAAVWTAASRRRRLRCFN